MERDAGQPGPPPRAHRLVLAFPSAAARRGIDPLLSALDVHWRRGGLIATHIGLDPSAPDPALKDRFRGALHKIDGRQPLVVGGFSLGARIAALAAPGTRAEALLCFGYPFHTRGSPEHQPGLDALRELTLPTWIAQGSRDAHGNREEVRGYRGLCSDLELHWVDNANHRLEKRGAAERGSTGSLAVAAQAAIAFLDRLPHGPTHD